MNQFGFLNQHEQMMRGCGCGGGGNKKLQVPRRTIRSAPIPRPQTVNTVRSLGTKVTPRTRV